MADGILLCDIGNTSLKIGIAAKDTIDATFVFPSIPESTPDSLGLSLAGALGYMCAPQPELCVAASVVPALDSIIAQAVRKYAGCETLFVPADLPVPLENRYKRTQEVGADILVGAYAAKNVFPDTDSLIVVDFGTAVTFACVSGNAFSGGLIFPGPGTAAAALSSRTAKLPHVGLDADNPEPAPGLDTVTSIRHGLLFGYVSVTEGLCALLARQLRPPVKIVATGGFAGTIGRLTNIFDAVRPHLVLDGLKQIYAAHKLRNRQP